ncbi:MAG TPA: hypothetical protein VE783_06030 [Candidatus Limnocylindrales bacterium]|jgi:hypothetical protein|nr:hypothetical protein [Candidatus Limnocylindrales bacterium]
MKLSSLVIAAMLSLASAAAQDAPQLTDQKQKVEFFQTIPGPGAGPDAMFVSVEPMEMGKVVKGAPYSATAVTESTQMLADGNRIVRKQTTQVARDGEGRVRRELGEMAGPLQIDAPKLVMIHDPVAKTAFILNPAAQTARVLKHEDGPGMHGMAGMRVQHEKMPSGSVKRTHPLDQMTSNTESLGTQTIEGIVAEGRRETRTIPAGAIGNEQPITITTEIWQAKDLGVTVLRKRSDPRFGETSYRLTNIKTGEPDPLLFQVPSGFKTITGPGRNMPIPPPPGE